MRRRKKLWGRGAAGRLPAETRTPRFSEVPNAAGFLRRRDPYPLKRTCRQDSLKIGRTAALGCPAAFLAPTRKPAQAGRLCYTVRRRLSSTANALQDRRDPPPHTTWRSGLRKKARKQHGVGFAEKTLSGLRDQRTDTRVWLSHRSVGKFRKGRTGSRLECKTSTSSPPQSISDRRDPSAKRWRSGLQKKAKGGVRTSEKSR